jgi:hypothetical protein
MITYDRGQTDEISEGAPNWRPLRAANLAGDHRGPMGYLVGDPEGRQIANSYSI